MTLKEICDEYYNMVYRRCLYELKFDEAAADEVTQQVFLILCEKWTLLKYHPNLKGWLLKTTANKLLKRKAGYIENHSAISMDDKNFIEPLKETDIYEQLICIQLEKDMKRYANEVYVQLSESERVLLGYLHEKKKYAEIAQLMNTTEGAISMRVVRLYRKVRGIVRKIVDNIL